MWNSGYVSEVDYTFGHFSFLSPNSLKFAALMEGGKHSVPDNPTYLELGFGQGISLNMHAASNAGQYWGADFSPTQTSTALEYARHGAGNLKLFDDSFQDLLLRPDLPQFDIIVLHGIWSWVPRKARAAIVQIARNHLKPGGLFYISYNVSAGWEGIAPLRDLLAQHYKSHRSGTVVDRVSAALAFATEVLEADAKFFAQNPIAKAQLEDMKKKDPIYLAHEFFNETWDPMSFSEICDALAPAKLDHLGSSTLLDGLESIHLTPKAKDILSLAPDARAAGDLRDVFVSQRFRRDIFVKGLRTHTPHARQRQLLQQKFMLIKHAENLPETIKGARGTANLDQDLYGRILEAFTTDNGYILSVKDILTAPVSQPLTYTQIDQALRVLVDLGMLVPISPEEVVGAVRPGTERMNAKLCRNAAFDDSVKYLASPVIGTGVAVSRFEQLFINNLSRNLGDPAEYVWKMFEAQGQRLQKNGGVLETAEANLAELQNQFEAFQKNRLPLLHRLGVVSAEGKLDLAHEDPLDL
ncbi:class I SAM-dependent methyltransferase [Sulfitobacter sp. W074]|uniref:class I SAM-dependent methyltransferase n=1 Tax=Sulfitobacter sp. W074 TaxID=2867026 RepID=UPI0021A83A0B|nr:class I SAM-dependent methyltransferase [Sulfitobacter sp. W074]UWR39439.1 class I SAM-dependent methyltransferase [Sulfitobacter sp. W074]